MPGGEALAGGVLPASALPGGPGRRRRHRVERGGGATQSLGFLEVFLSAAPGRASLEPQAGPSRLLRPAAESAPAHEAAGPPPPPPPPRRRPPPPRAPCPPISRTLPP